MSTAPLGTQVKKDDDYLHIREWDADYYLFSHVKRQKGAEWKTAQTLHNSLK